FFSSRRRHTRSKRDWSSDVCSSDLSPEQVKEQPLDHQTDIYSMGVVLYNLLTGRLPFRATNNFTLIYQITNVEAEPPSAFRPEIPAGLDALVLRAMAKDLGTRYRHWEEFSLDLAALFRARYQRGKTGEPFADTDKFDTLRKLPFFQNFSDAELWEVARISTWRQAAEGEALMKEGEPGDFFCILARGQVKVTKNGRLLNLLGAGEPFRSGEPFADTDKFDTLRKLPFFQNFSDAELWEVARISTWRQAAEGEALMKEGEPGDFFCILARGQVKVTKNGRLLNLLGAGEPF